MNPSTDSMFEEPSSEPIQKRRRTEDTQSDAGASDGIESSHLSPPVVRDQEYYFEGDGADCVILVENTLFKVKYLLYLRPLFYSYCSAGAPLHFVERLVCLSEYVHHARRKWSRRLHPSARGVQ